jgi:hypothetical protein
MPTSIAMLLRAYTHQAHSSALRTTGSAGRSRGFYRGTGLYAELLLSHSILFRFLAYGVLAFHYFVQQGSKPVQATTFA